MIDNLYDLGKVLARKYLLVKTAYTVSLFGVYLRAGELCPGFLFRLSKKLLVKVY